MSTLLISQIPADISDSALKAQLNLWGSISNFRRESPTSARVKFDDPIIARYVLENRVIPIGDSRAVVTNAPLSPVSSYPSIPVPPVISSGPSASRPKTPLQRRENPAPSSEQRAKTPNKTKAPLPGQPFPVHPLPRVAPMAPPVGFANHVFWQYDHVQPRTKADVSAFFSNLEKLLGRLHRPIVAVGNARHIPDDVTHQLALESVELQHQVGFKDMADRCLESKIEDFLKRAGDNDHVVIVATEGRAWMPLTNKKFDRRIVVVKSRDRAVDPSLLSVATLNCVFDFEDLCALGAPIAPLPLPSVSSRRVPPHSGGGSSSSSTGETHPKSQSASPPLHPSRSHAVTPSRGRQSDDREGRPEAKRAHSARRTSSQRRGPSAGRHFSGPFPLSVESKSQLRAALEQLKMGGYEPTLVLVRAAIKKVNLERFNLLWGSNEADPKWQEELEKIRNDPEFAVIPSSRSAGQHCIFFAHQEWDYVFIEDHKDPYPPERWSALVGYLMELPPDRLRLSTASFIGAASEIKRNGTPVLTSVREAELNHMVRLAIYQPQFGFLTKPGGGNEIFINRQRLEELHRLYNPSSAGPVAHHQPAQPSPPPRVPTPPPPPQPVIAPAPAPRQDNPVAPPPRDSPAPRVEPRLADVLQLMDLFRISEPQAVNLLVEHGCDLERAVHSNLN